MNTIILRQYLVVYATAAGVYKNPLIMAASGDEALLSVVRSDPDYDHLCCVSEWKGTAS